MKFSGKICLKIILKFTKNQGFSLSLEDTFFGKPQGEGVNLTSSAVLGLTHFNPNATLGWNWLTNWPTTKIERTYNVLNIVCKFSLGHVSIWLWLHCKQTCTGKALNLHTVFMPVVKVSWDLCQTSKMELFPKTEVERGWLLPQKAQC